MGVCATNGVFGVKEVFGCVMGCFEYKWVFWVERGVWWVKRGVWRAKISVWGRTGVFGGEKGVSGYNGVFGVELGCFGPNRCVGSEKGYRDIMGCFEVFEGVDGCRRDNGVFGA